MIHKILTSEVTSLADFRKNPMAIMNESTTGVVAVLNQSKPVFYCVSSLMMEELNKCFDANNLRGNQDDL